MKIRSEITFKGRNMGTAVVIPFYNEAKRFNPETFDIAIKKTDANFFLIDDGSTDKGATAKLLEQLHRQYGDRVEFATLSKNSGKSEAVRAGYQIALRKNPKLVGFFDADGAVPFTEINEISKKFDYSKDISAVIGVRTRLAGHEVERNAMKFLSQKIIVALARRLDIPVSTDTQCGAKLFDAKQAAQIINKPFISQRWLGCDLEFLARLARLRENNNKNWLFEYPVPVWKDVQNSTRRASSYANALLDYIKIYKSMKLKV